MAGSGGRKQCTSAPCDFCSCPSVMLHDVLGSDSTADGETSDIQIDLKRILSYYQRRYAGAMYSGCGGGYAIVASEEPVPGALKVKVKTC